MTLNRAIRALVREFVSETPQHLMPFEVQRDPEGATIFVLVRPRNSSRVVRITARVTMAEEL